MSRVFVHIDQLLLRGFRTEDRHAIAAGLQAELMQTWSRGTPTPRPGEDLGRLRLRAVSVRHGTRPQAIGASVARGIDAGLRK
jgi:hypothetical protein